MTFKEELASKMGAVALRISKNSPSILFGVGLVGVLGGTAMACRATLKAKDDLGKFREDVSAVKALREGPSDSGYPSDESNKDLAYVYLRNSSDIIRRYAPAAVVIGASVACLTRSHNQLMRRNEALVAAYVVLGDAFSGYRDRVREKLGEEEEKDLYLGRRLIAGPVDADGGAPSDEYQAESASSPYSRFFDGCNSTLWVKDPTMNELFLRCQQNHANHLLSSRGHLFLNEVYDMLGMERTPAGAVVGWLRDGSGDEFVDFDYQRIQTGLDPAVWYLDFNVDGLIYERI